MQTTKLPIALLALFALVLAGAGCMSAAPLDEVEEVAEEMMEEMEDMAEDVKDEAEDVMEDAKEEVDEMTDDEDDAPESDAADTVTFNITGNNFAFSETEMRVKEGDTVRVVFESTQGFHDWVVDEFDAATAQVREGGGSTEVTFVADKAGTYEYYCSVGQHRANGMVGNLIVE